METVVVMSSDLARSVSEGADSKEVKEVVRLIESAGGTLHPLALRPPRRNEPQYFIVTGTSPLSARVLEQRMRSVAGIEAVYNKPDAELP